MHWPCCTVPERNVSVTVATEPKRGGGDKKLNMKPEVVDCFSFNCQLDLNVLSEP